jgi:D-alanine-D-alanine ligase
MKKVLILINELTGNPGKDELDVLVQSQAIETTLMELGYQTRKQFFSLDLGSTLGVLTDWQPDGVFNLVESLAGRGSLIHLAPSLLESMSVPFTGSGTYAMIATTDKLRCKQLLRKAGIPTPDWIPNWDEPTTSAKPGKYILKPVSEDGSVGITDESFLVIDAPEKYTFPLNENGPVLFAEEFIDGREFNLSVLDGPAGPEVLPAAEMVYINYPEEKPRILNYASKWDEDSFEYKNTQRSFDLRPEDETLVMEMNRISLECWKLFELKGYARVDFRIDHNNKPFVLEVNANPCISPDAGFPAACEKAGISYTLMAQRIIRSI